VSVQGVSLTVRLSLKAAVDSNISPSAFCARADWSLTGVFSMIDLAVVFDALVNELDLRSPDTLWSNVSIFRNGKPTSD